MLRIIHIEETSIIIFLISQQKICCDLSLELSWQDSSNERSHHTFNGEIGEIIP